MRPALKLSAARLLAALILCCLAVPAAQAARHLDYLYVEANEGDSSGGHVALRFGDEVFHFQHEAQGLLRLQRHDSDAFDYAYGVLGNRGSRESTIPVSDETYTLLLKAFGRFHMVQGARLERRDALHRDVALMEQLLRQKGAGGAGDLVLPVSTVGYFLPGAAARPPAPAVAQSPALVSLRDRIRATYGPGFIAERISRAKGTLESLELRATREAPTGFDDDAFPAFAATASMRYEDAVHALCALELLQSSPRLLEGTFWTPQGGPFRLEAGEVRALQKYAAQLESELVLLAESRRSDWGSPFLVGMARLAAIRATLESGRLVLLDIFPRDGHLPAGHDAALRPYLPLLAADLRDAFLQKRKMFFGSGAFREGDYAALERAANLLLETERALATGDRLRVVPREPFPSREAQVKVPAPGRQGTEALSRELAAARAAEREHVTALERLYSYDLVRRNCVTELFSVINRTIARAPSATEPAAGGADASSREESQKRLGGFVDARRGLTFIPLVSSLAVERSYAVCAVRERPSYRSRRLAEMKEREGALKVFLREGNTVTSSLYRPGPGDSAFLFFTDDLIMPRPLFGAVNLLTGLGEALIGTLTLPFEGPERLVSGARGAIFSIPELVFVNLRKGSMAYVEDAARMQVR